MLLGIGLLFIIGNFPQLITVPFEFVGEFILDRIIPQPSSGSSTLSATWRSEPLSFSAGAPPGTPL